MDAMPSGVSRVLVTWIVLRKCEIGLYRTVTVGSHRWHMDTHIKCLVLASLEWTCFLLPLPSLSGSFGILSLVLLVSLDAVLLPCIPPSHQIVFFLGDLISVGIIGTSE